MKFIVTKYSFFVITLGFFFTILCGVLFFYFLPACVVPLSLIDSILISTSLITGVGITPFSLSNLTYLGKIISISLMYVGSVGIITILFALLVYFSIYSVEWYGIAREMIDIITINNMNTFLKIIFFISFFVQTLGAGIFYFISYNKGFSIPFIDSLFASVNFFCNVGLPMVDILPEAFMNNSFFYLVASAIIILGSSGFFIFFEVQRYYFATKARQGYNFSLTFYLLLVAYLGSIMLFWAFYFFSSEKFFSLLSLSRSFFAAVSLRSCGISPYHNLPSSLIFISSLYGILGSCPCGTGGGMKSTVFGILCFTFFSLVKKERGVVILNKTVSWFFVALAHIFTFYIFFFTLCISLIIDVASSHTIDFFLIYSDILGLITGSGTPWTELILKIGEGGKIIFIVLMILGKISTISFSFYLSKIKKETIQYPEAKLIII
jgi:trk system potassium uptake protein TrkH